jgi:putative SOS response-associated peptidase YedK
MLVLLDNNFVDRDGLRAYFEASADHRAAIPHTAFFEWHKSMAEKVTRRVLQQAGLYSSRIVILRDTNSILHMRGQPRVTPQSCGRCSNQFGNLTALPPRKRWRE